MGKPERWIGALKSAGEAPIDAPMMQELDRATDAALGRCKTLCVATGLIVCVLGIVVSLVPVFGLSHAWYGISVLAVLIVLLLCLAAGGSALHAWRVRRMVALVRKDGRVERFVLSPARIEGLVAAKALGLVPQDVEPSTAEIYCATRTLARIDARCPPFDHPKIMAPVEVWEDEGRVEGGALRSDHAGPEHPGAQRSLTESERSEIKRLLSRQREEIAKWAIVAVLCGGFAALTAPEVYASIAKGLWIPICVSSLWGLAAVGGSTIGVFMLVGEVVARARVRTSLRDDGLLRLSEADIRQELRSDSARGVLVGSAECFRSSGIVWTVEGEPAEWRTEPGRRSLRRLPRSRAALERRGPTA